MLLGTTLHISFDEKIFLLIVARNLFHKAAFMNIVFLKHCRINLLGLKHKTPLVVTLDIYFLILAHFFDNHMMHDNGNYTSYSLRSNMSPRQNSTLPTSKIDIYNMVRNKEFRNVRKDLQENSKKT